MKQVRENLYIGNLADMYKVTGKEPGLDAKITHVLSLVATNLLHPFPSFGDTLQHNPLALRKSCSEGNLTQKSERVVSVARPSRDSVSFSCEVFGKITMLKVPMEDDPSENLLDRLESCLEFINKGRKQGAVLVHCVAGVSRSASMVVAYLMRIENLSLQEALRSLQDVSPTACPNKGFMEQLQMFENMGCKVDHSHPIYRSFKESRKMLGHRFM
eukprot:TRINITY_DN16143_c0_g2_i2.p1 TRINITY_DN16143_c0_g2~~TRINITY_DN16143_c0_g2_i2.p1  ORF type:complete len:215 (+),score=28.39 TRINITY_DN16143_c0_g2_i2:102-746(+)